MSLHDSHEMTSYLNNYKQTKLPSLLLRRLNPIRHGGVVGNEILATPVSTTFSMSKYLYIKTKSCVRTICIKMIFVGNIAWQSKLIFLFS